MIRATQGGKVADPTWRAQRASAAGRASSLAYAKRRAEIGERYADKGVAYQAGYRAGYSTAMRWWRRKFTQLAQRREVKEG